MSYEPPTSPLDKRKGRDPSPEGGSGLRAQSSRLSAPGSQLTTPRHYDAVVIGSGLSGLVAAATLADAGARVYVIAKGGGYLHFTSGCVDVLGTGAGGEPVRDPRRALDALIKRNPAHPYALSGIKALEQGLQLFSRVASDFDYPFVGDLTRNITLPTAIGSTRATCLAPASMAAGDLNDNRPMLVAGFKTFRDFYPPYLAANLSTMVPFPVHGAYLDLPQLHGRHHLLSLDMARTFADPSFRQAVARQVKANIQDAGRVGFPAVLGEQSSRDVVAHLEEMIGLRLGASLTPRSGHPEGTRPAVFEIPTLPPSVAGYRVHHAFRKWLMRRGVRLEIGFWVQGRIEASHVHEVVVDSAGHSTRYTADAFVLATGGTGGGGIKAYPDGRLEEIVFGLPVEGPRARAAWFHPSFLGRDPQPISLVGVRTDDRLRPLDASGNPIENLFITASNLPSWDPTREQSGEGVAIATGWKAASEASKLIARHVTARPNAESATFSSSPSPLEGEGVRG